MPSTTRAKFPVEGLLVLLGGIIGTALAGNVTIGADHGNVNAWDPNGADRTIQLPDADDYTDVLYVFSNIGTSTYNLVVKKPDASTLVTVRRGEFVVVGSINSDWGVAASGGSAFDGGGATRVQAGAVTPTAEITANGSAQNTAHGLGRTPVFAFAAFTSLPAGLAAGATIGAVTYDATNLTVTVAPSGAKYRIIYG